jgi:membrane-bound ClpP family serine protease
MQKIPPTAMKILVSISYCCIIISGMHVGGPWIAYLLITLFTSVFYPLPFIYALLGIGGLVLYLIQPYRKLGGIYLQRITGLAAMYLSLILFFTGEGGAYNESTFREAVPLITLALFVLLSVWQIVLLISDWQKQQKLEQK